MDDQKKPPCLYPLTCMDCKEAYSKSACKNSTGLCNGCLQKRLSREWWRDLARSLTATPVSRRIARHGLRFKGFLSNKTGHA